MHFGTTKSPSSPSKPPSSTDTGTGIFAVACTLQSHLHAIEQRFLAGQETNDSLKRRKNELTEVLRLFRIVEENEVALSNELEEEVEEAVRESGLGYEDAAEIRLDPEADVDVIMKRSVRRMRMRAADDKENGHPSSLTDGKLPSSGTFKPRVAIPPRWKKVIALSASASPSRATSSGSRMTPSTTLSGTGTLSGTNTGSGTGTTTLTSGTPPLSLSTLSQTQTSSITGDTASISSSTGTTGGLCGSLRTSKTTKSKSKTTTKKNFKLNRRRPSSSGSGSDTTAKPYKTRRSRSLRLSPVLVVHYNKTSTGNTGAGSGGAGRGGAGRGGLGGLGGGGMWNATRSATADSATGSGGEGEFSFVM